MQVYRSRFGKLPATSYGEAIKLARKEYHKIEKRSRRQPYVKSMYFKKQKIFINQFWNHLGQKNRADGLRRIRLFMPAIDLLRNSTLPPDITHTTSHRRERLYRFAGKTKDNELFYVQVRQSGNSRKYFMSVFPK